MKEILDNLIELTATQKEILTNQEHQDKLLERHANLLEKQGETLQKNTIIVEKHHQRSLMLEKRQDTLEEEVQPAIDHVKEASGAKKAAFWFISIIGVLGTGLGAYFTLVRILKG